MSAVMNPVARGLDGVVVDETKVCLADKQTDRLFYRGYAIEDLAAEAGYEEVAYLLVNGDLPTRAQLEAYRQRLAAQRALPAPVAAVLDQLPATSDPMDVLRTACSVLGSLEPENKDHGLSAVGERVMACLPTALLYWYHHHHGGKAATAGSGEPDAAGNLLTLLHGTPPDTLRRRAIEVSLIVYAEHDFNASTFAARVAASTLSDAYSSFVAAISTLKGPLHGSANAAVLRFLTKFTSADEAEAAALDMLAKKARIPGFGQRAYSKSDPRNAVNKPWAKKLCEAAGEPLLYDVANRIEEVLMRERKMFANLDYYTAIIYEKCGLPLGLFAPMFFLARLPGLIAHIGEQRGNNRLIHPSSSYTGLQPRRFLRLDER
jgi:2-methylcitrate synthase